MKKFAARIVINNQANDGMYTKAFLLMMYKMGALISVAVEMYTSLDDGEMQIVNLHLEDSYDMKIFKRM